MAYLELGDLRDPDEQLLPALLAVAIAEGMGPSRRVEPAPADCWAGRLAGASGLNGAGMLVRTVRDSL